MDFSLYTILDIGFLKKNTVEEVAIQMARGGATVIQLRDKRGSTGKLLENALRIKNALRKFNTLFIINDRLDIALASEADGVHLGDEDIPLEVARKILGKKMIIGATVRNIKEAKRKEREGADYIGLGSIFKTETKRVKKIVGVDMIRKVKKEVSIPVVAIGGINRRNVAEVLREGADGIAIISGIMKARNIEERVGEFKKIIEMHIIR